VKTLARKKQEASSGGGAPWLNTFADLMNLLLCFFVMLFAFSDINQEDFQKVAISMSNAFNVFEGGGSSIGNGELISAGTSQLSQLDVYISQMGKTSNQTGIDTTGQADKSNPINTESGNQGSEDTQNPSDNQGSDFNESTQNVSINEAIAKVEEKMADASAGMYDEISDLTDQYNLSDYVELSIDPNSKYVELTLKGSILFDSGEAEVKKEALPILKSIGKILKKFEGYSVEITGHTDNVPVNTSEYRDNNWLSSARALNASEYLIDECKVDPTMLKYSGRGEYEPISSNSTEEGRAKNRRIEIKIYNEYSSN
jgi:chemotaxis protein MotB